MGLDETRSFTQTRPVAATRSDVFDAWTRPELLAKWYFNPQFLPPDEPITVDLRVGGTWRLIMAYDAESSAATGGIYREIVPGKRLVFDMGAVDGCPASTPSAQTQCRWYRSRSTMLQTTPRR